MSEPTYTEGVRIEIHPGSARYSGRALLRDLKPFESITAPKPKQTGSFLSPCRACCRLRQQKPLPIAAKRSLKFDTNTHINALLYNIQNHISNGFSLFRVHEASFFLFGIFSYQAPYTLSRVFILNDIRTDVGKIYSKLFPRRIINE